MDTLPTPDKRIPLQRLATMLDVTTRTILRWRLRGVRGQRLKSRRLGGLLFFTAEDVAEFIERSKG